MGSQQQSEYIDKILTKPAPCVKQYPVRECPGGSNKSEERNLRGPRRITQPFEAAPEHASEVCPLPPTIYSP